MKQPRVFITYTHDSDAHKNRVLKLSERLRADGVDSNIDQYEVSPPEGWPAWMRRQIKEADIVLIICSENYLKRYEGTEARGRGSGAKWEGGIITQELYEAEGRNTKFIPVVFTRDDINYIPIEMRKGTYYLLDSDARYDDLYAHLTDQPRTVKGELGRLRQLPPVREQESAGSKHVEAPMESNLVVPSKPSQLPLVLLVQPGGHAIFVRAQRIQKSR